MDDMLLKYLDAKFEKVGVCLEAQKDLLTSYAEEQKALGLRVARLESWRAYITGGMAIFTIFATGLWGLLKGGFVTLFLTPGPK